MVRRVSEAQNLPPPQCHGAIMVLVALWDRALPRIGIGHRQWLRE